MQHQTVPQTREIQAHELAAGMTVIDGTDGPLVVTSVSQDAIGSLLVSFEGVPEPTLYGRLVTVNVVDDQPPALEFALAEILTAVNGVDPVGAYDDYDDCSADELHIHKQLNRIRDRITVIRAENDLPMDGTDATEQPAALDYWLTLADDLRQAADRIAGLAGAAAPTWVRLDIVGVAPQDASKASATIIDGLADVFGTEARTSDGGTVQRYGMGARHGVVDVNGYTYLPLEDSELTRLRARVAELESQTTGGTR